MIKLLKNKSFLLFFIITLTFFCWYLFRLTEIPIFADEAIYLNWSKRIALGDENIFISMYDGKPPLFMWLAGLGSLFNKNLLLVGRLISVLSLFIATTFIFFKLKKKSISWAFLSLIFILGNTFLFFHSRFSLLDSLFSSLITVSILTWSNQKSKHSDWLTGIFLGLAFFTKTPALFLLPLPLLTLILKRNKKTLIKVTKVFGVFLFMVGILKTNIWFPSLFNRSQDFSFSILEVLNGQTNHIFDNFKTITGWLSFYLTWPVLLLSILGSLKAIKKKNTLVINLSLASLLFLLPLTILGKIITSRYFLPLGFTLPIIASYYLSTLSKEYITLIIAAFLGLSIPNNYQFQDNYFYAQLPKEDNHQYFRDWSSGIGLESVSQFINQESLDKKVLVLTEGTFGTLPDGLFVYQANHENFNNLEIIGVTSPNSTTYKKELKNSHADIIYYVGNHNRINEQFRQENKLVASYDKKDGGFALEVYKVKK